MLTAFSVNAQEVNWITFDEAIAANEKSPKPILVDIYTDWCHYCKKMDKETYANKVIADYINENFYAVKFNGEGKGDVTYRGKVFKYVEYKRKNGRLGKYHEFAAAVLKGKMSYPSTAFFSKDQNLVKVYGGYKRVDQFKEILALYAGK